MKFCKNKECSLSPNCARFKPENSNAEVFIPKVFEDTLKMKCIFFFQKPQEIARNAKITAKIKNRILSMLIFAPMLTFSQTDIELKKVNPNGTKEIIPDLVIKRNENGFSLYETSANGSLKPLPKFVVETSEIKLEKPKMVILNDDEDAVRKEEDSSIFLFD